MGFRISSVIASVIVVGLSVYSLTLSGKFSSRNMIHDQMICLAGALTEEWNTTKCGDLIDEACAKLEEELKERNRVLDDDHYCLLRQRLAKKAIASAWITVAVIVVSVAVLVYAVVLVFKEKQTDIIAVYDNHP